MSDTLLTARSIKHRVPSKVGRVSELQRLKQPHLMTFFRDQNDDERDDTELTSSAPEIG